MVMILMRLERLSIVGVGRNVSMTRLGDLSFETLSMHEADSHGEFK